MVYIASGLQNLVTLSALRDRNLERRGAKDDGGDDDGDGDDNENPLPATILGNMGRTTMDHNSRKHIGNNSILARDRFVCWTEGDTGNPFH